jgi:hypothetical protein
MAQARATSSPLIESDRVEGTAVHARDGKHIGAIKRLMIEKRSGKVAYVVMSFTGLGLGPETYTIPWAKLHYEVDLGGYRTDISESELRGAPSFARTSEDTPLTEAQEEELHAHFQIPPYWRAL